MIADFPSILAAAGTGAEWAIAIIYRDINPSLLRYLRAQAPDIAEDLASDVWMAVAPQLQSFEGNQDAFRGWIFTIARRKLIGHWKQTSRRKTSAVSNEELERQGSDDPESTAITTLDTQAAIARLTEELPPEQAEVVLLRVVAGLDVNQVAQILGKSPVSIRVTQHRALRRLAETFLPESVTQ